MSRRELEALARRVQQAFYLEHYSKVDSPLARKANFLWYPYKEWDTDTLPEVAGALREADLTPPEVMPWVPPGN